MRNAPATSVDASKPSATAASASDVDAVAPHTVRPALAAARSTEPPISPSPITHTSRTAPILPDSRISRAACPARRRRTWRRRRPVRPRRTHPVGMVGWSLLRGEVGWARAEEGERSRHPLQDVGEVLRPHDRVGHALGIRRAEHLGGQVEHALGLELVGDGDGETGPEVGHDPAAVRLADLLADVGHLGAQEACGCAPTSSGWCPPVRRTRGSTLSVVPARDARRR